MINGGSLGTRMLGGVLMLGAGVWASLRIRSGRKGKGGIERPFVVQVRSIFVVRLRLLTISRSSCY